MLDNEKLSVADFAEKSYLDYSMYVILDRALPFIGDGLKPVQRRIIYAMSELGLKHSAKYKKSARTVGDVLGKFHPHGDSACYESMVLMAQPFSYRYPFIDGQGNWGAIDEPKSFAAMRYTESKLSKYAELLLSDVNVGTTDFIANFDGTLIEPKNLPARVPNILLNGASGIAVGMATDIPSHNMTEILSACIKLLDKPNADIDEIMTIIQAPDFPSQANIISTQEEIKEFYTKGFGSVKMRATYSTQDNNLIIKSLPYQASGAKIISQISKMMQQKKLPMLVDICDESDHKNPIRIVLKGKNKKIDFDSLMLHLCFHTDLEKSYRINMNCINLNGNPELMSLLDILRNYLSFRKDIVIRHLKFKLNNIVARLHILEGLMTAYINIDEVIAIIRAQDNPQPVLMKRFDLDLIQAKAILELRLRHLAKLEETKIKEEQKELLTSQKKIESLLTSDNKLKNLMKKELRKIIKEYGDDRMSTIKAVKKAINIDQAVFVPAENITVVLSKKGWIRAAKGHDLDGTTLNYKAEDGFLLSVNAKTDQNCIFLDNQGKSYTLAVSQMPNAKGGGEPLSAKFASNSNFVQMFVANNQNVLLATNTGYGFICHDKNLVSHKKSGKKTMFLTANACILPVCKTQDNGLVAVATNLGRLLIFNIEYLPTLAKGKGVKLINIPHKNSGQEFVCSVATLDYDDGLLVHTIKRKFVVKKNELKFYMGKRASRGVLVPRGFRKISYIIKQIKIAE